MTLKIDPQDHRTLPVCLLDYVLNLKHYALKNSWNTASNVLWFSRKMIIFSHKN